MALPDNSGLFRSSKDLRITKTIPLFGELVKPLIESPGNATALAAPGCFSAISLMRRMTESVRSSEAADGSCANAMRYCLSCDGTKPVGILLNEKPVNASRPTYTTSEMAERRIRRATPREYLCAVHSKNRLNGRKNQPKARSIRRDTRSFGAS